MAGTVARSSVRLFVLTLVASALWGCGGGGGSGGGQPPPPPKDSTPPVINLAGTNPQIVELNGAYTELGAMAADNVDGDLSASIVIDSSAVDTSTPGNYSVTYNVTDAAGNAASTVTRTVTVIAAAPPQAGIKANPSILLSGSTTNLTWGSIYANSCTASGSWNGPISTSGTLTTDPLTAASTFIVECSGAGGSASARTSVSLTTFPVANVSIEIRPTILEVGQSAQSVAITYDSSSTPLEGRLVTWTSDDEAIATVSDTGRVIARSPGEVTIIAASEEQSAQLIVTVLPSGTDDRQQKIESMYANLAARIEDAIAYNESLIAGNPHSYDVTAALLELLRTPTLEEEIRSEKRVEATAVTSSDGRRLPIVSMFPRESAREDAIRANGYAQLALALVEEFLQTPFPRDGIDLWYGFYIGSRGGAGTILSEDEATYEARRGPVVLGYLPFEAIIQHEVSHSYFSHEQLTQFLELYSYNRIYTNSLDANEWIHTRDYVPFLETNAYTHGLLDIYQLIGHDAMARAFQALYQLSPPYGEPLSEQGKLAIVNEALPEQQSQVREILERGI